MTPRASSVSMAGAYAIDARERAREATELLRVAAALATYVDGLRDARDGSADLLSELALEVLRRGRALEMFADEIAGWCDGLARDDARTG